MKNKTKFENVKLMHETMLSMNNEDAYMCWIWIMPDCPYDDDFEWFANNEKEYEDLVCKFTSILDRYLEDGLFKPSKEVVEFLHSQNRTFDIFGGVC